jgi:hypothetical protein
MRGPPLGPPGRRSRVVQGFNNKAQIVAGGSVEMRLALAMRWYAQGVVTRGQGPRSPAATAPLSRARSAGVDARERTGLGAASDAAEPARPARHGATRSRRPWTGWTALQSAAVGRRPHASHRLGEPGSQPEQASDPSAGDL